MENIIKVNIESRIASLPEGMDHITLFDSDAYHCKAVYLQQNREHKGQTRNNDIVVYIFQGIGELECKNSKQILNVQLVKGDIVFIPVGCFYKILNVSTSYLMSAIMNAKK